MMMYLKLDVTESPLFAPGQAFLKRNNPIAKRLLKFKFKTFESVAPGGKEQVMEERGKIIV